jgi:DNA invertase Pin-like site-specific DNA recombinase
MNTHLYLRASTKDQDSLRALSSLQAFANEKGLHVVNTFSENASGTKLERPELMRMLEVAVEGDCVCVESVDRLSRLSLPDWQKLKNTIESKGLKLVVMDLPTSHQTLDSGITGAVMQVINSMLIDLMATMARLDQEKRVERIKQGIERKKELEPDWTPKGKGINQEKHTIVKDYLSRGGLKIEEIAKLAGVGVATVYRIKSAM